MEGLRKPLSHMAWRLFVAAKETYPDDNIIICPFAVTAVITMLYKASDGTPAGKQIENLMHYSMVNGRPDARAVLLSFREALKVFAKQKKLLAEGEDGNPEEFRLVKSTKVFIQRGANMDPEFVRLIEKTLKIEFVEVDFEDETDGRGHIEAWLREKTKYTGGLRARIPADMIDAHYHGPRMVIASASHYRAGFEMPFDPKKTRKSPFYLVNGKAIEVDMMNMTDRFAYAEDDSGLKVLDLPYFKNEVSLVLTIPVKRGALNEIQRTLNDEVFAKLDMRKRMKLVKVALPRLRFHSTYDIKKLLGQVGLKVSFQDDTLMANLTSADSFRTGEGIHTCAFQVDEKGTFLEDAESQKSEYSPSGHTMLPTPPGSQSGRVRSSSYEKTTKAAGDAEEFIANHPFLIALRHNRSGMFLFSGRVMIP